MCVGIYSHMCIYVCVISGFLTFDFFCFQTELSCFLDVLTNIQGGCHPKIPNMYLQRSSHS